MKHLQGKLGVVLELRKREANTLLKNAKIEKKEIKALVVIEQEAEVLEEIEEGKEALAEAFGGREEKEFEDSVSDSEEEQERRAKRDGIDEVDEEFEDALRGQVRRVAWRRVDGLTCRSTGCLRMMMKVRRKGISWRN
jgi:hypothetical protein